MSSDTTERDVIRIDGREYEIPSSYTLGEARTIKKITGLTLRGFAQQLETDATDPDVITSLVWVVMHREDSTVTIEHVESLDLGQLNEDAPEGEASPPVETAEV